LGGCDVKTGRWGYPSRFLAEDNPLRGRGMNQRPLMDGLPYHQVVQDFVDAGHAAGQVANVLVGVVFEHTLETDAVGNSTDHERRDPKARLRAQPAVNGLFESVRRGKAPR
jgi:hypothetical protein